MSGNHILAIGASGMLRHAVLELARQGHVVSLLARSRSRLKALEEACRDLSGTVLPLPLDYTDEAALSQGISVRLADAGPVSMVLSWIHSSAPGAPLAVADLVGNEAAPVPFFELCGSTAEPLAASSGHRALVSCPGIRLHVVQLGRIREAGSWRWLSDEEISAGSMAAIRAAEPYYLVGEL